MVFLESDYAYPSTYVAVWSCLSSLEVYLGLISFEQGVTQDPENSLTRPGSNQDVDLFKITFFDSVVTA
jgi:hypothetical protein